jgi:hypothetical protein
MPISTLGNRRSDTFDISLELRAYTAAAISATASTSAVDLIGAAMNEFKCAIIMGAFTSFVDTVNFWTFSVEVATTTTFVEVARFAPKSGAAQQVDIPLAGYLIDDAVPTAAKIRVTATKTGSPGALTYGAFLARDMC